MNNRHEILTIGSKCTACMACYNICPVNAINMDENVEGFFFPSIDDSICINCKKCDNVCPEIKNNIKAEKLEQKAYYGWHKDSNVRKASSSGGFFSIIAEYVIKKNGVVFGAVYNKNTKKVMHQSTLDVSLDELRKSKYVQSYIGNTYKQVKDLLNRNKLVLFVGTPCQVSGLQSFVGENPMLITCDFICHGVPSMKLLNEDLDFYSKKSRQKVVSFDFRPKIESWHQDFLSIIFEDNTKNIRWQNNGFYSGFMKNINLRRSCYRCRYSNIQHSSDFSIADFWGYYKYDKSIFDNRGISLILVNTKKGDNLLNILRSNKHTLNEINWKYANYVFRERTEKNYSLKKRDRFFKDVFDFGYYKAVKKNKLIPSLYIKMIRKIIKIKKSYFSKC